MAKSRFFIFFIAIISFHEVRCQLEKLTLNYQNISYDAGKDMINIGVDYSGRCPLFLEFFSISEIIGKMEFHRTIAAASSKISVSRSDIELDDGEWAFIRVVARNADDNHFCSDAYSQQTYYHIKNIAIPDWKLEQFHTVQLPIPADTACGSDHLFVVWPQMLNYDGSDCHCLPQRINHDFDECADRCTTEYDVTTDRDLIIFHNFSSAADSVFVHFLCEEDPCAGDSCLLVSIVASYKISIIDTNDTVIPVANDCEESTLKYYIIIPGVATPLLLYSFIITVCFCKLLSKYRRRIRLFKCLSSGSEIKSHPSDLTFVSPSSSMSLENSPKSSCVEAKSGAEKATKEVYPPKVLNHSIVGPRNC